MSFEFPNPFDITNVGYKTGKNVEGHWWFLESYQFSGFDKIYKKVKYDIYAYDFSFSVRAMNDVHVGLFPNSDYDLNENMYEIVIGGDSNTRSVIRRGENTEEKVHVDTLAIVN